MKFRTSADWFKYNPFRKRIIVTLFSILSIITIISPLTFSDRGINLTKLNINTSINRLNPHSTIDQSYENKETIPIHNSHQNTQLPSINLRYRLDKIQIGLIQNFSVRNQQIFLLGSYGLAILDLDQNETKIKRFRNTPVGIDNNSRIWYITENSNSIFQWDGQKTIEYRKEQGWILPVKFYKPPVPNQITSFLTDDQNIWLATSRDARIFNGFNWRIFTATEIGIKLPYKAGTESVFTMNRNPSNGDIWVAACYWKGTHWIGGSIPYQFDGKTWRISDFPEENPCLTSITFTADGSGFFTTPTSIWKYDSHNWIEVSLPFILNLPQNTTYQISQIWIDNLNTPWLLVSLINLNGISTQHLLFQYKGTTLNKISSFEGLTPPQIFFTSSGSVVSFRNNQIFLLTPTGWVLLADNNFDLVIQDNIRNVWLISDIKTKPVLWELIDQQPVLQGANQ